MNNVYTDPQEIENKVLDDYRENDVELNSLFFDFDVKLEKKALIEIYASLQHIINGDTVMRLENPIIEQIDENACNIWGTEMELIPEGKYEDIYEGNFKDFLESFNDKELETGFCRIIDVKENNDLIGGEKCDFVF